MRTDVHPDNHEITVVMTGGNGFKTRSNRGNAGNLADSGGPLAGSSKRFENFGLNGRGIPVV